MNKSVFDNFGVEIKPNTRYKISYELDKKVDTTLAIFFCNSDFMCLKSPNGYRYYSYSMNKTNKVSIVFKTPSNAKYFTFNMNFEEYDVPVGQSITMKNFQLQELL